MTPWLRLPIGSLILLCRPGTRSTVNRSLAVSATPVSRPRFCSPWVFREALVSNSLASSHWRQRLRITTTANMPATTSVPTTPRATVVEDASRKTKRTSMIGSMTRPATSALPPRVSVPPGHVFSRGRPRTIQDPEPNVTRRPGRSGLRATAGRMGLVAERSLRYRPPSGARPRPAVVI